MTFLVGFYTRAKESMFRGVFNQLILATVYVRLFFFSFLLVGEWVKDYLPRGSHTITLRKIYDDFCDFKVSSWGVSPLDYI